MKKCNKRKVEVLFQRMQFGLVFSRIGYIFGQFTKMEVSDRLGPQSMQLHQMTIQITMKGSEEKRSTGAV